MNLNHPQKEDPMDQKKHVSEQPVEDPELKCRKRSGDEEDPGTDPPSTKSGRRVNRR